jgi:NAD(P)-dependent dehydrogenase (short-subunit alcohol dehydrogenase family)
MNQLIGKASKKILIVGSSSFLGKSLIKSLSPENFLVCVDKKIDKKNSNKNIIYFNCDINNYIKLKKIKKKVAKKIKFIDIVINCFVEQNYSSFENQSYKKFNSSLKTNVSGIFSITKLFYQLLKKSNKPQIINLGSIYGMVSGDPNIYPNSKVTSDVYAASKAAIIQLTKYYAVHLSKYNIRVNCISPGGIFNYQNKKFIKKYIKKVPMKRMANVEEIVEVVKFLLNDKCKYINGHNLVIDGGFTSW